MCFNGKVILISTVYTVCTQISTLLIVQSYTQRCVQIAESNTCAFTLFHYIVHIPVPVWTTVCNSHCQHRRPYAYTQTHPHCSTISHSQEEASLRGEHSGRVCATPGCVDCAGLTGGGGKTAYERENTNTPAHTHTHTHTHARTCAHFLHGPLMCCFPQGHWVLLCMTNYTANIMSAQIKLFLSVQMCHGPTLALTNCTVHADWKRNMGLSSACNCQVKGRAGPLKVRR